MEKDGRITAVRDEIFVESEKKITEIFWDGENQALSITNVKVYTIKALFYFLNELNRLNQALFWAIRS